MKRIKLLYALTSIGFLLVLAVSPLKEVFKEWRSIQSDFNEYAEIQPFKVKKVNSGIKQIWNEELNITDRCVTCHVALDDDNLNNAPQPFKNHPKIYHEYEKFGCTTCHEGQGLATNYEEAHLPTEFWDKPLLPAKYTESSCFKCHDNLSNKLAPLYNKGKKLVEDLNCVSCHEIPNVKKLYTPGLNGIGSKIKNKQWLISWLKDPISYASNAGMPNFKLTDEDAEILADFLLSFKRNIYDFEKLPDYYENLKEEDDFINLGKTRFREARCISCHSIDNKGGKLAIDLVKVASKVNKEWIYNFIINPKALLPDVEMPQFGFSKKEVAAITAYIESEFVDWDIDEEELKEMPPAAGYFEKGIKLFNNYNCAGCHKLDLQELRENLGPDLSEISGKKMYQLEWGNSQPKHTIFEYIETKLALPREFGESTRMPQYNLSNDEITAITAFLLTLKKAEIPQGYLFKSEPDRTFNPQGNIGKIFNKYSCLKCHSVYNKGGDIAPDLSIVGSQLNREWTKKYFKIPYSLRAIVEERMPNLFIPENEVDALLEYFEQNFIDDELNLNIDLKTDPKDLEKGKVLFNEKYGCQSCHIIDGSGGYVGPPLDNVGERLKPGWIYSWIKNPQKYKPDTIEPNAGMNEEELILITSYLANKGI